MKKFVQIFLMLIFISHSIDAQNETNIWYFGEYAGIDFSSGSPEILTNSSMFQYEGCATISDPSGNLLFYTNGIEIWNKNHEQMQNGFGLMGGQSATQSAIIVKQPENDDIYYVFTVPQEIGDIGLRYSIVDISKDNGLGSVIIKNEFLISPTEEKVTAVKHYNNRDIWVITHLWNSDQFYVYLIDPNGLQMTPVISKGGSFHAGVDVHGSMKASPNGSKIAITYRTDENIELYDFDNKTGVISNLLPFKPQFTLGYGIEFSKDGSLLYIGDYYLQSTITQFDLSLGSNEDIIESGIKIGSVSNTHLGALQMGPDGKIYVAKHDNLLGDQYLGVINKPGMRGTDCYFVEDGLYLGSRRSFWGLPNFIQSYFYPLQSIIGEDVCFGEVSYFHPINTVDIDSALWNFGDFESNNNTSKDIETQHYYSAPGNYNVSLISYFKNYFDTSYLDITIFPYPEVDLGNDTTIAYGEYLILDAGEGPQYHWQDGINQRFYSVSKEGTYWVRVYNDECSATDTIVVDFYDNCDVSINNVFTPNSDGINDDFFARSENHPADFTMIIFNRWGKIVAKTESVEFKWDGRKNGTLVPAGVYFWVIKYKCPGSPNNQTLKGSVTVMY